jgi:hypothetical protein
MKIRMIITMLGISLAAYALPVNIAASGEAVLSSSDMKFTSRIAKKQKTLSCMGQDMEELKKACKSSIAKNQQKIEKEVSGYVARLELKLSSLVKESMRDIECYSNAPANPTFMHNLLPESKFDKANFEEEFKKRKK